MKKKFIAALLCIGCLTTAFTIGITLKNDNTTNNLPLVDIEFPLYAGEYDEKIQFIESEHIDTTNIQNTDSFYTINKIDETIIRKLVSKSGMNFNKKTSTNGDISQWSNDDQSIIQYGDTSVKYKDASVKKSEFHVSDAECKELSDALLSELDCENLVYSGIGYDTVTDLQTQAETIIAKTVYYNRVLNGKTIEGTSSAYVTIAGDGEIETFFCGMREIEKEYEVEDENIISVEEAIQNCKEFKGYIEMPEDTVRVEITKVETAYWEDSSPNSRNNTIQPIYKITGKAYNENGECSDFTALESALQK